MTKRTHKQTLKAILSVLKDGKGHSLGEIERKANTNWRTVRNHVELLIIFDCVVLKENKVKIIDKGRRIVQKL